MVAEADVAKHAGQNSGGNQAETTPDELHDEFRDAGNHATAHHDAAKTHGADNQPNGVHHATHAARCDKLGEHRAGSAYLCASIATDENAFAGCKKSRSSLGVGQKPDDMGLAERQGEGCHKNSDEQDSEGRELERD